MANYKINLLPKFNVTVFGGSQPHESDPAYKQAYKLGTDLGKRGINVLTGGYIGTMEAVSKGASLAGGYVIGVTCKEIENWRPVEPNEWIYEEIRFNTLRERLYALIDRCDAAIALPGGIGTLAEIVSMWSQLQTGSSPPKMLILVGAAWESTFKQFYKNLDMYVARNDRKWLIFVSDGEKAIEIIDNHRILAVPFNQEIE